MHGDDFMSHHMDGWMGIVQGSMHTRMHAVYQVCSSTTISSNDDDRYSVYFGMNVASALHIVARQAL